MTVAVIVHVDSDKSYVDALRERFDGVRLIACALQPKTPIMAFDGRLPLILVWSAGAAAQGAGQALVSLARVHEGEAIVCVTDGTAPPKAFDRMSLAVVNGSPRSPLFPGGLQAALTEAHRRQLFSEAARAKAPAPPPTLAAPRRAFADGVARGLAGSVAVFGVGGAVAMAVDSAPGAAEFDAAGPFVTAEESAAATFEAAETEMARAFVEAPSVDPTLFDVPLGNPSAEEVATIQAARFVTDEPLAEWRPEMLDLEQMAPLSDAPIDLAEFRFDDFLVKEQAGETIATAPVPDRAPALISTPVSTAAALEPRSKLEPTI